MAWMLDGKATPRKGEAGFLCRRPAVTGQGVGPPCQSVAVAFTLLHFRTGSSSQCGPQLERGLDCASPALYRRVLTISHLGLLQP